MITFVESIHPSIGNEFDVTGGDEQDLNRDYVHYISSAGNLVLGRLGLTSSNQISVVNLDSANRKHGFIP